MGEPFFPAKSYAAAEAHFDRLTDYQNTFGSSHLSSSDSSAVEKKWDKFKKLRPKRHKSVKQATDKAEHKEGDGG